MPPRYNPRQTGAQSVDYLEEMLRAGRAPTLAKLLALAPPWPVGEPGEVMRLNGRRQLITVQRTEWPKEIRTLLAKFSGLQPDKQTREEMKYRQTPPAGAPLSEFVRVTIDRARAWWSRDVISRDTHLQFDVWLRDHIAGNIPGVRPLWTGSPGWSEAYQLLRLACGLSRIAPTRGAR